MNDSSSTVLAIYADIHFGGGYTPDDNLTAVRVGSDQNGDIVEFACCYTDNGLIRLRFKVYGSIELYAGAELLCRRAQDISIGQMDAINCAAVLATLKIPPKKAHLIELIAKAWEQLLTEVNRNA